MKKIIFLMLSLMQIALTVSSQTPPAFKYQAVARNSDGSLIQNQPVAFRISILQGGASGTLVYQECHTAATNNYGLVNLEIGRGSVLSGTFSSIDWASGQMFLKTELDPGGGTAYIDMGTTELLSVPYALYSGQSSSGWSLTGNSGTDPGSNFIGTTDISALKFRVNNEPSGFIDPPGPANTGLGYFSLRANTSGTNNTAVGFNSLFSNISGSNNTAHGNQALFLNTTGWGNTASGVSALNSNNGGYGNTASGAWALWNNTGGNRNTVSGMDVLNKNTEGSDNTALGYRAGYNQTGGSNNIFLGSNSGPLSDTNLNNSMWLGNTAENKPAIFGDLTNGRIGIGTSNPDSSAMFEVRSDNQGFLLPRMTSFQISLIDNPADGLEVYSTTDGKLYLFVAQEGRWKEIDFGEGIIIPIDTCGIITDQRDGQVYTTVKIAEQCWMGGNLNIGTEIYSDDTASNNDTIEKYCYYSYGCIYGGLYTWNEMMQYSTEQGTQGICPDGWHLPTENEWTILVEYLGGISIAGYKLKEYGITHWNYPNQASNLSGFTALPGGLFYENFILIGTHAYFWTSSETDLNTAFSVVLFNNLMVASKELIIKNKGCSVRCIRD